jgi:hypothetical protein
VIYLILCPVKENPKEVHLYQIDLEMNLKKLMKTKVYEEKEKL